MNFFYVYVAFSQFLVFAYLFVVFWGECNVSVLKSLIGFF